MMMMMSVLQDPGEFKSKSKPVRCTRRGLSQFLCPY